MGFSDYISPKFIFYLGTCGILGLFTYINTDEQLKSRLESDLNSGLEKISKPLVKAFDEFGKGAEMVFPIVCPPCANAIAAEKISKYLEENSKKLKE